MKAALLTAFHADLTLEELPVPSPGVGEALVRVAAAGLSRVDLQIIQGHITTVRPPIVLGHEMVGVVVQLGPVTSGIECGKRVIVNAHIACQACVYCRAGHPNLCHDLRRLGFDLDGAYGEYVKVPVQNLIPIPDQIPDERAAVIPNALSTSYHALKTRGRVQTGWKVLILGIGGLGMQALQIAKWLGAEVLVTSRKPSKLDIAARLGADHTINTTHHFLLDSVREIDYDGVEVVLDLIGTRESMEAAIQLLKPGGRVVVVGQAGYSFIVPFRAVLEGEKEILAATGYTMQELHDVVQLVETGTVRPYVSDLYSLSEINLALSALQAGRIYGRAVIKP